MINFFTIYTYLYKDCRDFKHVLHVLEDTDTVEFELLTTKINLFHSQGFRRLGLLCTVCNLY
jgi:hypothetical protein